MEESHLHKNLLSAQKDERQINLYKFLLGKQTIHLQQSLKIIGFTGLPLKKMDSISFQSSKDSH